MTYAHQKTHQYIGGFFDTYKALNSYVFVARKSLFVFSQFRVVVELFMIIYRDRLVPQALYECFAQDQTRYPQLHLLNYSQAGQYGHLMR